MGNHTDKELEIRPLRQDDALDDLIELSRAFFAEYESHHPDFFQIDSLEASDIVNYFTRWLDDEAGETFIALDNGRIVGTLTIYVQNQPAYWQVKRVGHISGLMVDSAFRQQGIAGRLLAEAQAFFRERGVRYFTVYTAVANQAALNFYDKFGLSPLYTTLLGEVKLAK
jgi:ribosomal protein S18 acetylase RimI-like enzyme